MTTTFTALCANDINTRLDAVLDVLGRTNHVHHKDAVLVHLVDNPLGRNTDRRHKQLGARFNNHIHKLRERPVRVIIVGFAGAFADLGQEQIDAKRRVLVLEVVLEVLDGLFEHLRGVVDTANDTKASCVRHGGGEGRARGDVHPGEDDGVLDPEEFGLRLRVRSVSLGMPCCARRAAAGARPNASSEMPKFGPIQSRGKDTAGLRRNFTRSV